MHTETSGIIESLLLCTFYVEEKNLTFNNDDDKIIIIIIIIIIINPLNAEINPTCQLLALLGAHHILHVSKIKINTRH